MSSHMESEMRAPRAPMTPAIEDHRKAESFRGNEIAKRSTLAHATAERNAALQSNMAGAKAYDAEAPEAAAAPAAAAGAATVAATAPAVPSNASTSAASAGEANAGEAAAPAAAAAAATGGAPAAAAEGGAAAQAPSRLKKRLKVAR